MKPLRVSGDTMSYNYTADFMGGVLLQGSGPSPNTRHSFTFYPKLWIWFVRKNTPISRGVEPHSGEISKYVYARWFLSGY